jgi:hypothetical protein
MFRGRGNASHLRRYRSGPARLHQSCHLRIARRFGRYGHAGPLVRYFIAISTSGRQETVSQRQRPSGDFGATAVRSDRQRLGFEPVSAETQPVSGQPPTQISDIEKSPSRDSLRISPPAARDVRIFSPETEPLAANLRKCGHFRECPKSPTERSLRLAGQRGFEPRWSK